MRLESKLDRGVYLCVGLVVLVGLWLGRRVVLGRLAWDGRVEGRVAWLLDHLLPWRCCQLPLELRR